MKTVGGRPARTDWRSPVTLRHVPRGVFVHLSIYAGEKNNASTVRGAVLSASAQNLVILTDANVEKTFKTTSVVRWRLVESPLSVGELVSKLGVPEFEWRGVVISLIGDGMVEVDSTNGTEILFWDELKSVDLTIAGKHIRVRPGPPSADPLVEELNQDYWRKPSEEWAE